MTVPGVNESLPSVNRSKFSGKEAFDEPHPKPMSFGLGLQVSRCLDPQVSSQGAVMVAYANTLARSYENWPDNERTRYWKGICALITSMCISRSRRICGSSGRRLHQGQERNTYCQNVCRSHLELYGRELLGTRLLRLNSRSRRRGHSKLHSAAET